MLSNYPDRNAADQRLAAVEAALQIIKASAEAPSAYTGYQKVQHDVKQAIEFIGPLADAIEEALKTK